MSDMTLPLHEAFKIKSYSWEDRGISIDQARDKTTTPSKIEFFLGIRMEMVDPLLRKAIEIFANKGYIPYDSCQGHNENDSAHIGFHKNFTHEVDQYFLSLEDQGVEIFNNRVIYIKKQKHKTPESLREFMIAIAENAPKIGDLVFLEERSHNGPFIHHIGIREKFPNLYRIEDLPPERFYPPHKKDLTLHVPKSLSKFLQVVKRK